MDYSINNISNEPNNVYPKPIKDEYLNKKDDAETEKEKKTNEIPEASISEENQVKPEDLVIKEETVKNIIQLVSGAAPVPEKDSSVKFPGQDNIDILS